jgi:hypothetical protein
VFRRRHLGWAGSFVLAAAMFSACSGSDEPTDAQRPRLAAALSSVPDSPTARKAVEWANLQRLHQLALPADIGGEGESPTESKWALAVVNFGGGPLLSSAVAPGAHPVDVSTARDGISIGSRRGDAGTLAYRIDGIDTGKARESLVAAGGRGQSVAGEDGVVFDPSAVNSLPRDMRPKVVYVATDGDRLAYGQKESALPAVLSGTPTLADDPIYRETAGCLGKVLAATLVPAPRGILTTPVDLIGVGVLDPAQPSEPVREIICLHTPTPEAAEAARATIQHRLDSILPPDDPRVASRSVTHPDGDGGRNARAEVVLAPDRAVAGQAFVALSATGSPTTLVDRLLALATGK